MINTYKNQTFAFLAGGFLAGFIISSAILDLSAQENIGRGRVAGQVIDEEGQPVAEAIIIVQSLEGSTKIEGKSDQKGHFAVAGMGTGKWRVSAHKEGYIESFVVMPISQLRVNPSVTLKMKKADRAVALLNDKSILEAIDKGNTLIEEGKYDEAIASFEEVLAKYPNLYPVHLNIAGACLKKGNLERAETEFKTTLDQIQALGDLSKDKTAAINAMSGLGEVALKRGDFEAASKFLSETLNLSPDDEVAAYNVGEIFFSNQKIDRAISYFEMAIRIKPDWSKAYYKLGFVYLNKGQYDKSLEYFKKFIELDPDNPEVPNVKNIMAAIEKMKKGAKA